MWAKLVSLILMMAFVFAEASPAQAQYRPSNRKSQQSLNICSQSLAELFIKSTSIEPPPIVKSFGTLKPFKPRPVFGLRNLVIERPLFFVSKYLSRNRWASGSLVRWSADFAIGTGIFMAALGPVDIAFESGKTHWRNYNIEIQATHYNTLVKFDLRFENQLENNFLLKSKLENGRFNLRKQTTLNAIDQSTRQKVFNQSLYYIDIYELHNKHPGETARTQGEIYRVILEGQIPDEIVTSSNEEQLQEIIEVKEVLAFDYEAALELVMPSESLMSDRNLPLAQKLIDHRKNVLEQSNYVQDIQKFKSQKIISDGDALHYIQADLQLQSVYKIDSILGAKEEATLAEVRQDILKQIQASKR